MVDIAMWVLQVLLALFFVFHAYLLLWPSPERPQAGMRWVLEMPAGLRAAIPAWGRFGPYHS
jgi:hypothetical protein